MKHPASAFPGNARPTPDGQYLFNRPEPEPLKSPDGLDLREHLLASAEVFLVECGQTPTPDAIRQLVDAFLPALTVMCKRGYNPDGETWKKGGWRGLLFELRKKTERMWHRSWTNDQFDDDSPIDMINYAGFYYRFRCEGLPWGEWGEPGAGNLDPISLGDYSEIRNGSKTAT